MQEVEGLHADDGGVGSDDWLFDDDLSAAEAGTETYWSGNYCSSRNVQGLEVQKYHFPVSSSEARNVRYNSLFRAGISQKKTDRERAQARRTRNHGHHECNQETDTAPDQKFILKIPKTRSFFCEPFFFNHGCTANVSDDGLGKKEIK